MSFDVGIDARHVFVGLAGPLRRNGLNPSPPFFMLPCSGVLTLGSPLWQ